MAVESSHGTTCSYRISGALYHLVSRGNGRQRVFLADGDYQRLVDGLESAAPKFAWHVLTFVWMPNHLHLLLKTPQAYLSVGMQYLLSGYANWFSKRDQRPGHLFQGRFKGELIQDDTYFWTVSRSIYLNPTRGRRPLVSHPRQWPWSSYPGHDHARKRRNWLAYDLLRSAWQGENWGAVIRPRPTGARVEAGLQDRPVNPLGSAAHGWLLGSEAFVDRIRSLMRDPQNADEVPAAKQLRASELSGILEAVANHDEAPVRQLAHMRRRDMRRAVVAWLARRYIQTTRRETSAALGLVPL